MYAERGIHIYLDTHIDHESVQIKYDKKKIWVRKLFFSMVCKVLIINKVEKSQRCKTEGRK